MVVKGINLQLGPADVVFLERRGARSHRGGGEFSRSAVLHRAIQGLRTVLENADPRPRLSPAVYAAAIELLPTAWTLKPLEIQHLGEVIQGTPEFASVLSRSKLEAKAFVAAIAALSFAEKFALVDLAVQTHAPAAAGAHPAEE
jgi:hypothetical protein